MKNSNNIFWKCCETESGPEGLDMLRISLSIILNVSIFWGGGPGPKVYCITGNVCKKYLRHLPYLKNEIVFDHPPLVGMRVYGCYLVYLKHFSILHHLKVLAFWSMRRVCFSYISAKRTFSHLWPYYAGLHNFPNEVDISF